MDDESKIMEILQKIIIEVTDGSVNVGNITINEKFEDFGMDSLKLVKFLIGIEQEFSIEIEEELFDFENFNTMKKVIEYVAGKVYKNANV